MEILSRRSSKVDTELFEEFITGAWSIEEESLSISS